MADLLVLIVLFIIIGAATAYIIKQEKKGVRCIGCSAGGSCGGKCGGNSDCH